MDMEDDIIHIEYCSCLERIGIRAPYFDPEVYKKIVYNFQYHGQCECSCSRCLQLMADNPEVYPLDIPMCVQPASGASAVQCESESFGGEKLTSDDSSQLFCQGFATEHNHSGNLHPVSDQIRLKTICSPPQVDDCIILPSQSIPTDQTSRFPMYTDNVQPVLTTTDTPKEPVFTGNYLNGVDFAFSQPLEHFFKKIPTQSDLVVQAQEYPVLQRPSATNRTGFVGHESGDGPSTFAARPNLDTGTTHAIRKRERKKIQSGRQSDKLCGSLSVAIPTIMETIENTPIADQIPKKWKQLKILNFTENYIKQCLTDFNPIKHNVTDEYVALHAVRRERPTRKRTYDYWDPFRKCATTFEYMHDVLIAYVSLNIIDGADNPLSAYRISGRQRQIISKTGFDRVILTCKINVHNTSIKNRDYQIQCHRDRFIILDLPSYFGCRAMSMEEYQKKLLFLEKNSEIVKKNTLPGEFERLCGVAINTLPSSSSDVLSSSTTATTE